MSNVTIECDVDDDGMKSKYLFKRLVVEAPCDERRARMTRE